MISSQTLSKIEELFTLNDKQAKFHARQLLFANIPASVFVETYLNNNEGQPQKLDLFPMLRPIYDFMPKRLLLKCSRKTLKSTINSNMIVLNLIRYNDYSMMYVVPSEMSTKDFSKNYLSPRLDSPALKKIISGWRADDVFEKILEDTGSSIKLRYVKDDASRTRGPSIAHLIVDECVTKHTNVRQDVGGRSKNILDVHQGDDILGFDEWGNVYPDKVAKVVPKGIRHVWKVTLSDKSTLECTANEKILTNHGWVYLTQLLPQCEINRCPKARAIAAIGRNAKTAYTRHSTWRRLCDVSGQVSKIPMFPWGQAKRLRAPQGACANPLYTYASGPDREPGVRQGTLRFFNGDFTDIRILTHDVLSKGARQVHQDNHTCLVESTDLGRNSLLVYGRRLPWQEVRDDYFQYTRIYTTGSPDVTNLVDYLNRAHLSIYHSLNAIQNQCAQEILSALQKSTDQLARQILYRSHLPTSTDEYDQSGLPPTAQERPSLSAKKEKSWTALLPEDSGLEITAIEYLGLQPVYDIETARYHTFFANGIAVHNCQDINLHALPIILETMAMLDVERECYTGTPLTTDNCIQELWKSSCQMEWMTKCGCGHWNSLTEDNDPMSMIRKAGLSCHKCSKVINTMNGEWVMFKPEKADFVGYHLAQPILPHYNLNPSKWEKIYRDVYDGFYTMGQIFNEKFGLAYDAGVKLISEAEIRKCCVLGPSIVGGKHKIYNEHQHRYKVITAGVDWGVNPAKSRSVIVVGGLREDMVYEVFYHKIYEDIEYDQQIEEMGNVLHRYDGWVAADSGPDSLRSIHLIQRMSLGNENNRGQLVRYEDKPQLIQTYKIPTDSVDWRSHRLCLHRTDTLTFTINLLKKQRILLPQWEEIEKPAQDILAEYVEIREGPARQVMDYKHSPSRPDDFLHALNFAAVQAHIWAQDPTLTGPASTSNYASDEPNAE